ncbi:MAG: T9SS type A sorting domain-containing protein [Ferruginibacter sp.]
MGFITVGNCWQFTGLSQSCCCLCCCKRSKAGSISIFDASGRLVKLQKVQAGANTIDINGLASGTYFCQVDGSTVQFIKQ